MESAPVEISPEDLYRRLQAGDDLQLIDVREDMEFEYCHLPGSVLVPLSELTRRTNEIRSEGPAVLICHHGVRSMQALSYLQQRLGFQNLLSLRGGVAAWAEQVDPSFPTY
ncbi:rhodanese-like domain-containing protein [Hymenobacter rubidus]|uniref:rhodanese-like domain-containing protein n=1 Tax=Hymenobacter rubidus TaxID=1441626 RepID=UPI00191CE9CA|nr:rhodanese-like domain-containing protein [Hymenobacter rubidus]